MHRFIETEGLTAQQFYSAVSRELDEQLDKDRAFASIPGAAMGKTPFSSEYEGGLGFDSALCKDSKVDRSSLHTNTNDSDVKEYKMYGNTEQGSKAEEKIQIESSDCK